MNERVFELTNHFGFPTRTLLKRLFAQLNQLKVGKLTLHLPGIDNPLIFIGSHDGPEGIMIMKRPVTALRKIILREATGLGESYMDEDWDTPNLSALLHVLGANEHHLTSGFSFKRLGRVFDRIQHLLFRRNSKSGSRRNISYHYDLGNDFYELWLDKSMTYSSAVFKDNVFSDDLFEAQQEKYKRLLDQLNAQPGQRILEIGCGWGGFAEFAAKQGIQVNGITLSQEQLTYAKQRIEQQNLDHLASFELRDYRDVTEQYDHVVSIEMFEAVGESYWPTYFEKVKSCLKPGGKAALQIITINNDVFYRYRNGADFIQKYIFPGGMLPSPEKLNELTEDAGFITSDTQFHGLDYAETLALWHQSFLQHKERIELMGYDNHFQRMWTFYLSYCEAGFRVGRINLVHLTLDSSQ